MAGLSARGQVALPGRHEPRAPHAAERHHRLWSSGSCATAAAISPTSEFRRAFAPSNDVPDYSKLEADHRPLSESVFDLEQFLHDGLRPMRAEAVGVALHLPPATAIAVKGNERLLPMPRSTCWPTPSRSCRRRGQASGSRATGRGIPPDQFQPSTKSTTTRPPHQNGTGLSLPLSRKLAERHCRGSTAVLSLPDRTVALDGLWTGLAGSA